MCYVFRDLNKNHRHDSQHFFYPKRYFFLIFSSLAIILLFLSILLIEIWSKHAKMTFTSTFNTMGLKRCYVIAFHYK